MHFCAGHPPCPATPLASEMSNACHALLRCQAHAASRRRPPGAARPCDMAATKASDFLEEIEEHILVMNWGTLGYFGILWDGPFQ